MDIFVTISEPERITLENAADLLEELGHAGAEVLRRVIRPQYLDPPDAFTAEYQALYAEWRHYRNADRHGTPVGPYVTFPRPQFDT